MILHFRPRRSESRPSTTSTRTKSSEQSMESYEKFDYSLRPNKRTQRKMIFDALARYIAVFSKRRFGYVGFGSMWFADFLYAHRRLGVKSLVSIEKTEGYRRALFNRPFKCVPVIEGDSYVGLPSLDWKQSSIV